MNIGTAPVFVAISQGTEVTQVIGAWTNRDQALEAAVVDIFETLDRTTTPDEFEELQRALHTGAG